MPFQQWTLYVRDKRGQVLSNAKSTIMMLLSLLLKKIQEIGTNIQQVDVK